MRSPYAVRRPVENEYLVRERDRRRLRDLVVVAGTVLLLGAGLLAYTWIHTEITQVGYRVSDLEERLHELRQEERRLRLEVARKTHPRLVEERARSELGMRPPRVEQTFFVNDPLGEPPPREP